MAVDRRGDGPRRAARRPRPGVPELLLRCSPCRRGGDAGLPRRRGHTGLPARAGSRGARPRQPWRGSAKHRRTGKRSGRPLRCGRREPGRGPGLRHSRDCVRRHVPLRDALFCGAGSVSGQRRRRRQLHVLHGAQPQAAAVRRAGLRYPLDLRHRARGRRSLGDGDGADAALHHQFRQVPVRRQALLPRSGRDRDPHQSLRRWAGPQPAQRPGCHVPKRSAPARPARRRLAPGHRRACGRRGRDFADSRRANRRPRPSPSSGRHAAALVRRARRAGSRCGT